MKRERYSYSKILDDVTRYFTKIQTNEYLETGLFPIIDQGKEFITGYTNSSIGIYNDYPIIIFGDHTRIFKYIDFPCYLGADGVKALKNIKPDKINSKYLYYYLKNSYIPDTGYNRHFKWVKELFFNIHDIHTQKDIVAVLDKVTLLISMRKEQLEKLDILVKSKFIEMFGDPVLNPKGWEKKKLGEVCDVVVGGDVPLDNFSKEKNEDYNIPIYSNGLAENMLYGYTNNARIQQPCVTVSARGTIGYCFPHFKPFYPIVRLLCVIPSNNFSILFLCHQINSINIKSSGSGVAQLTSPMIKSCALIIPPLDIQNQFAEFVEHVEKNKENIKSSLNQLETLYSALMQEYFG